MSRNGRLALAFHVVFVVFMLAPIIIVCAVAFTPEGYLSFPTHGLSLRWFKAIARYPEFVSAFWTSIWLGVVSSAIALAFSVPSALAIARHDFTGREAITALFMSPLMIPHVVLGIAFLRFFTQIGLGNTFLGLVLAHIVVVFPSRCALRWPRPSAWIAPSSRRRPRSAPRTGLCFGASPCPLSCRGLSADGHWLSFKASMR
jgi:putative spermidine/putrescine transport system permease protein